MNANEEIVPPEEITPQAMLEHFVVNFYEMFKGDNPPGHFSRLRNDAVEGAWWRGFCRGKEEGYRKGYYAAKAEIMTADEAAEAATQHIMDGLCKTVWKRVE